jgi:hypothetical protein
METNWNQLIELYLQNELSEEGRSAFEQELSINPELREELDMHQLIRSAAKRASQRNMIRQTGQAYLRNLRIKQFTVGVVVTAIAVTGIIYWTQNKNEKNNDKAEKVSLNSEKNSEELVCRAYQINHQPNQPGGKSSLIQPTDWQTTGENEDAEMHTQFNYLKGSNPDNSHTGKDDFVKTQRDAYHDSVSLPKPTVTVLGYTNDKLKGEVIETSSKRSSPEGAAWILRYDSVGKFNDLYCGYALVMNKSKFGFVDPEGKIFIPIIYDQLVVTTNIKSSKQKNRRQNKKKVLYIPKRSGKNVKDCDEQAGKGSYEIIPRAEEVERKLK